MNGVLSLNMKKEKDYKLVNRAWILALINERQKAPRTKEHPFRRSGYTERAHSVFVCPCELERFAHIGPTKPECLS